MNSGPRYVGSPSRALLSPLITAVLCILALAASLMVAAAHAADAAAPDALVKVTVERVMGAIKHSKNKGALLDLAEKEVLPHFDFTQMTRLAMGRSWREANEAQKKALEKEFRRLLVNTYTEALVQVAKNDQTVEVKPVRVQPDQKDVVVKTLVRESGRSPFAIDYSMERTAGGWKVYDVVVESLSLVTNYRGSFSSEVARGGIDGLIRTLERKNRQLASG